MSKHWPCAELCDYLGSLDRTKQIVFIRHGEKLVRCALLQLDMAVFGCAVKAISGLCAGTRWCRQSQHKQPAICKKCLLSFWVVKHLPLKSACTCRMKARGRPLIWTARALSEQRNCTRRVSNNVHALPSSSSSSLCMSREQSSSTNQLYHYGCRCRSSATILARF